MRALNFKETLEVLNKYKIPFCKTELIETKREAFKLAKEIGYPVALKVSSDKILHKTDVGAVKTGIENKKELKQYWEEIIQNISNKVSKIEGMLLQEQIPGHEVIIGLKRNERFGPVIMFGLGGVFVEVLKDVSFRIAPIDKKEAGEMIKEIKGFKILQGARGKEPANLDKLADILVSVSDLSLKETKIKEIDFNPIIVNKKRASVIDARILI